MEQLPSRTPALFLVPVSVPIFTLMRSCAFLFFPPCETGGQCTSYIRVFFFNEDFIMADIFQPSDKIKLISILF